MKINLNNKKQQLYTYILILLGFFMFLSYIWYRFICERLPRDIPFTLTTRSFTFIIIIIISSIYIIYSIKKPKQPSKILFELLNILHKLLIPLELFDNFLKKNVSVQQKVIYFFSYIIKNLKLYNDHRNNYIFVLCVIIPKQIILFSFFLDIVFFKHLYIFYYILLLNIIPLIYSYILYSLQKQFETSLLFLEKNFYIVVLSTTEEEDNNVKFFVCSVNNLKDYEDSIHDPLWVGDSFKDIKFFIEMQANNLIYNYDLYDYTCVETDKAREEYAKNYNIKIPINKRSYKPEFDTISITLKKTFDSVITRIIFIKAFLEVCQKITKPTFIESNQNIILILGYLICWLYILFVSLHTLNILELLDTIKTISAEISEPFSDITLSNMFLIFYKKIKVTGTSVTFYKQKYKNQQGQQKKEEYLKEEQNTMVNTTNENHTNI